MAAADFLNGTLVLVDPSILSCWEEKVKQGLDCSLMLKHSKGMVNTILKCNVVVGSPDARKPSPQSAASSPQTQERKKKKKKKRKNNGGRKKLESLISYQERLTKEKGLPPSRLMLQHAAAVQSLPLQEFQCDQCDFTSTSKRVLSNHKSHKHKNSEKPEILRDLELNQSLNLSHASEEREELSSVNADMEEPDVEEIEKMREVLEETNKCLFCGFKAAVPWVHPSKGTNLSGMDIWDHVWANHPTETEWFA